jgi:hypothetical protein
MTNPKIIREPMPPAPLGPGAARLLAVLKPRLDRLADDAWLLARRAPALAADPALVAASAALLAELRRLLRHEPGAHLLPKEGFAGPIGLNALALALRQLQAGLALFVARHAPPGRSTADELDDITRMSALFLRDIAGRAMAQRHIALPPDLRPAPAPPPPAPPRNKPPAPKPAIRRTMTRRRNSARRTGRR